MLKLEYDLPIEASLVYTKIKKINNKKYVKYLSN